MRCSCLSVLLVYATQRTANFVALAILIGTYQLVSDKLHARGRRRRRVMCLPPATHCYLLPLLSGTLPILLKFVSAPRVLFYRVYFHGHP